MRKNQEAILTKLLISHLVIALEYLSWSQKLLGRLPYLMGNKNKFILILMIFDEKIIIN